jgi:hypothetical protein
MNLDDLKSVWKESAKTDEQSVGSQQLFAQGSKPPKNACFTR